MVKIISDSTCDLSPDLLKRYDVDILPLHIVLGDQEYEDGQNITPDEIYRWSDAHRASPKTAAISIQEAESFLRPYLAQGCEVVCFTISGSMSSTCSNLQLAAEQLSAEGRVIVIDSQNLSTGVGLLVIEAAVMAREGKSADEIKARIEALRPLVRASFVVDTLTFLHRGGRCTGLAAMMGGALKLHPRIAVADGKMAPGRKYRGRMDNVILNYARDMENELRSARRERVFITHSGCTQEVIASVQSYLESLNHFDEILITRAGGVISSHCGPGTLGVLFIAGE
ncbi:MAG: DegV family protein [Clostridia bacterium]|nr:DegV family protein [Clostridia bacterium]